MTVKQTENKQKDGRHRLTGPGPGRTKGGQNKFTSLKQSFLDAFVKIETESERKEKVKSLYAWATKNDRNQGMFYKMLSKMLPSNLTVDGDVKIHHFERTMTEFFTEHGTCTVEEFVKQLKSINGGGNGGGSSKLLAKSIAKLPPAKPDRSP